MSMLGLDTNGWIGCVAPFRRWRTNPPVGLHSGQLRCKGLIGFAMDIASPLWHERLERLWTQNEFFAV